MAKYLKAVGFLTAFLIVLGVAESHEARASDLVKMLTSQLGVTDQQASGGAGSILNFAKGQMSAGDFNVVSDALPETNSLIAAAPSRSSSSDAMGSATSMLGGSSSGSAGGLTADATSAAGGLGDMAGVTSAFSDLGMSPEMVNEFVPVILEYAQTTGSEQAMKLLQGALTGL